jgi:hypothetical protein
MSDLGEHFAKSQKYLKLGDNETFKGLYIKWEAITTKFGKAGYRFTLEREDGSRVEWETGNAKAVQQFSDLLDDGLVKGMPIEITRHGIDKTDTRYDIKQGLLF